MYMYRSIGLPTFSNSNEGHFLAGVRAEQLTNTNGNRKGSYYTSTHFTV